MSKIISATWEQLHAQDAWEEDKHPRAKNGQFSKVAGSGAGASAKSEWQKGNGVGNLGRRGGAIAEGKLEEFEETLRDIDNERDKINATKPRGIEAKQEKANKLDELYNATKETAGKRNAFQNSPEYQNTKIASFAAKPTNNKEQYGVRGNNPLSAMVIENESIAHKKEAAKQMREQAQKLREMADGFEKTFANYSARGIKENYNRVKNKYGEEYAEERVKSRELTETSRDLIRLAENLEYRAKDIEQDIAHNERRSKEYGVKNAVQQLATGKTPVEAEEIKAKENRIYNTIFDNLPDSLKATLENMKVDPRG